MRLIRLVCAILLVCQPLYGDSFSEEYVSGRPIFETSYDVTVGNILKIGDGTDETIYIYANNGDTTLPNLRYNYSDNTWEYSNNGTSWTDIGSGGGGAPTDADYLVGTANGSLSAEIVVGTTPSGELGGTWASPTIDDLFLKLGGDTTTGDYDFTAGNLTTTGDINLSSTTASTIGVIYKGSDRFLHDFHHPTGDTAIPVGQNTFVGIGSGNFTFGSTATETAHSSRNVGLGYGTLASLAQGYRNTAVGYQTLALNISGYWNTAIGYQACYSNINGDSNYGMGFKALYYNELGDHNTAIGWQAGFGAADSSDFSGCTLIGYEAGDALLTGGDNNLFLGYRAGDNVTTGTKNIIIGYDGDAPAVDSTQTLNIGNLIFGTTLDGTGTTISTGNIGIGTNAPGSKLTIANGATSAGVIQINEDTTDGANNATFTVPALADDTDYTLPPDDGEPGEQLQTNGAGVTTWEAAGGAGATAFDDIGDPDAATTILFDNDEVISLSTAEETGAFLTLLSTDADLAGDTILLTLSFQQATDANQYFLQCKDNLADVPAIVFKIGTDGNTTIAGTLGVTGQITGNLTGNVTGNADTVTTNANLIGEVTSVGNTATISDNVTVQSWTLVSPVFTTAITATDLIKDTHIDWGTGAGQVSPADASNEDIGDITITGGAYAVENDSHDHSAAGSTVTIAVADITDDNAGTDITADLEEEVTEGSLADSTIISADIKDGVIIEPDLDADSVPNDGDILSYDSTGTNFAYIAPNAGTNITADLEEEVTEGSLADSTIVSADIKNATVAYADMVANIPGLPHAWHIPIGSPNDVVTGSNTLVLVKATDAALTVTKIEATTSSASYEIAGDLKYADARIGLANAVVINVFDTVSGVLSDSSITSGAVAAGKCVYLQFDSVPNASMTDCGITVFWDYD